MHSWIFQCPTFRTLLVALYRHDANTPAQDRTQLGVTELVKGAVVVDRRVDYLHGLSFEAVGDLLERVSHGGSCCGGRGAAMDIGGWLRNAGTPKMLRE